MQICPPLDVLGMSFLTIVAFNSKKRSCAQTLTMWRRDHLTPFTSYMFNNTVLWSANCFQNWEVEIRNTLRAQTANVMAARKIIQPQRAFKKQTHEWVSSSMFLLHFVIRFNLGKWGMVKKVSAICRAWLLLFIIRNNWWVCLECT